MENEKYQTFLDLLKYAKEREYPLIKAHEMYLQTSKEIYNDEIERGNIQDLFSQHSNTESKLIRTCIQKIDEYLTQN
jgi:hypothetical protein